jgi:hypothetical protein
MSDNIGIVFGGTSSITSTGTGANAANITLVGNGGTGADSGENGITLTDSSYLATVDGDISLTGVAGDNGPNSAGVIIYQLAHIDSTGVGASAGNISITGTGGAGQASNHGIFLWGNGGDVAITAVDGDITLTGTAQHAAAFDITTDTGTNVVGGPTDTGDITLNFDNHSLANVSFETNGDIILQPRSVGTTVGVAGGAGALDLNAALLDLMDAGHDIVVGRVNGSGDMHVDARTWTSGLHLRSASGVINIDGAQDVGAHNLTITSDGDPVVGAALAGTGILTLEQASLATTMGVTGGAGTLNYSAADLAALGAGWTSLVLGSATATGTLETGAHAWSIPVTWRAGAGGNILISGNQTTTAASAATFTFSGPPTLSANLDTSAATGGSRAITFNAPVTLGADAHVTAGGGAVAFNDTLDGNQNLEITTTGDVTFAGDVGGITPLADVTVDPHDLVAGGSFNAASFTLTGGTGNVDFSGGGGLTATGDIHIATNGNILGTYTGTNGVLDAGAGSIAATVSFAALDISGAGATLLAGYIGAPGAADQTMADLISIGGLRDPWPPGIPNPAYTFAGFIIAGDVVVPGGGGGGSDQNSAPPPVTPPITRPITPPTPDHPPVIVPALTPTPQEPASHNFLPDGYPYNATERPYILLGQGSSFTLDPGPLVRWREGSDVSLQDCDQNTIIACQK